MVRLYILALLPVTYALVGAILVGLWARRKRRRPRPSFRDHPSDWLSNWLGPLIAFEIVVWSATALTYLLMLTLTPLMDTEEAAPALLAFGTCLGGSATLLLAFDVALFALIRRLARHV